MAAITVAAAAGLVGMTARYSAGYDEASHLCRDADDLRRRATQLADADGEAYAAVLAALRDRAKDDDGGARVRATLVEATEVPLAIVDCARRTVLVGVPLFISGNKNLRGDVLTAVTLAEAGAVSAAHLVRINSRRGDLDGSHVETAAIWCAETRDAVRRVQGLL